jgi:hypothetical protein
MFEQFESQFAKDFRSMYTPPFPPSTRFPYGASSSRSGRRAVRRSAFGNRADGDGAMYGRTDGRVVICRRRGTLLAAARLAGSCGSNCRTCGGIAYGTRCARPV